MSLRCAAILRATFPDQADMTDPNRPQLAPVGANPLANMPYPAYTAAVEASGQARA